HHVLHATSSASLMTSRLSRSSQRSILSVTCWNSGNFGNVTTFSPSSFTLPSLGTWNASHTAKPGCNASSCRAMTNSHRRLRDAHYILDDERYIPPEIKEAVSQAL